MTPAINKPAPARDQSRTLRFMEYLRREKNRGCESSAFGKNSER